MRVIDVSRRSIAAGWGRCWAMRLLHFTAAQLVRPRRTSGATAGTWASARGVLLWLACDVFTGAKMRLDAGFNAAQARLANLAHGLRSRFP
jgi:hypothetical protein